MGARVFKDGEDWKSEILACPKCGWKGTFKHGVVEYYEEVMDSSCPVCSHEDPWNAPMLAVVEYPIVKLPGGSAF